MHVFITIYRPHGALHCDTKHFGPFPSDAAAYDFLCTLPALGIARSDQRPGVKYTEELCTPTPQAARQERTDALREARGGAHGWL